MGTVDAPLAAGVILGIDVFDAPGAHTVDLDDGVFVGIAVHRRAEGHDGHASLRQGRGLVAVEALPVGEVKCALMRIKGG